MNLISLCFTAHAQVPSIDQPLRTGAMAPADAAVVVGLEKYAYVAEVPYATRDAHAFRDFLVYARGVPIDKVRLLTTASAKMIERAVTEAAADVGPGGTLWVYYAGHGAASSSDGSRLLLADDVRQDPVAFEDSAVRVEELQHIAQVAGVHEVLVLDTCYSGLGRSGAALVEGKRFVVPVYAVLPPPDVTVWTAASGDELSGGYADAQHGMFTYFVVGALRGWADGELSGTRDGVVTRGEAQTYVARALRSIGERSQTPTLVGGADEALVSDVKESGPDLASLRPLGPSLPPVALPLLPTVTSAKLRKARGRLVAGTVVGLVGVGTGLGTWAVSRGSTPPPASTVVPLKVTNVVGWSLAGVGAGLATLALVEGPKLAADVAAGPGSFSFSGRF